MEGVFLCNCWWRRSREGEAVPRYSSRFLEAAKRMNVTPSNCLVIEGSLPGVAAGKAAGMHVIAVPSVPKKTAEFSSADEVIDSLLDVRPEKWGLPPFNDWIEGTLPIEPWFISGPVIKGFGRGSKVLGIPTAFCLTKKVARQKTPVGNVLTLYDRPTVSCWFAGPNL
ncbi:bifunctional riboflavin kinase/FMN phosphatase-like isoform X3 [Miscanthus floridulus]|uniref:bifunctional riboflavin kinase/FMN phosphatase-like isoform X3 n=1 Tax=Miscanthus floridulus TaxID=154761 RepID=UPI003459D3CA